MTKNGFLQNLNMEFKDFTNHEIYKRLQPGFANSPISSWRTFVLAQDIGVDLASEYWLSDWNVAWWEIQYVVTDEKKWLLAKIKYGM